MKHFYLIFVVAVSLAILGCSEDKQKRSAVAASNVKNVKLSFTNADRSKIGYGDTLEVTLSFETDQPIVDVNFESEDGPLPAHESDSLLYAIPTVGIGGGYHSIRALVMLRDSTVMRGSASLRVLRSTETPTWDYRLIEVYPHDRTSYTQGLIYANGWVYESAGRYSMSDIRKVNWRNGEVISRKQLEGDYFAEGLAMHDGRLFQLTWRESKVFVYNSETLEREKAFNASIGNGEGWGLCYNDSVFVLTDGSADLHFVNPEDWQSVGRVRVFDHQGDVRNLNELEFVGGKIYANILHEDRVAVIDPKTGMVQAYWDFSGLLESQPNVGRVDVMNGIAYCPDRSSFFVTGKLWPYMFEVNPVFR